MPAIATLVAVVAAVVACVVAVAVAGASSPRYNVKFSPLDPALTDPARFWMPLQNPVPNDYCTNPRYPAVPTFGDIAMDVLHELYPNGTVPSRAPPKPTNTWLKNLWGFNWTDTTNWGGVYPYPYIVQPRARVISLMYPGAPRNLTGNRAMQQGFTRPGPAPPGNPPVHNASYPYMVMSAAFDFTVQVLNGAAPRLGAANALSARVDYHTSNDKASRRVASLFIVKGSPFVTVRCAGAQLVLGANMGAPFFSPPVLSVNGLGPGAVASGRRFVFHIAEGPLHGEARKWHAWFSQPVTIAMWSGSPAPLVVTGSGANGGFTGTLKLASGEMRDDEEKLLDNISHTVALGASVEYDIDDAKNTTTVRFKWQMDGPGPLTMLALPHHTKIVQRDAVRTRTSFWCVKGNMTAVTANAWNLTYNVSNVGFINSRRVPAAKRAAVARAALFDYNMRVHRCPGDNDTYNGTHGFPGFMNVELYAYVRDLAQMTEIAMVLDSVGHRAEAINMTRKVLECLAPVMKRPAEAPQPCPPPINGTVQCVRDMMNVYYDTKWGGLITGWFDRFAMHYCQCDKPGGPYACRGLNYCDNPRGWDGFANYGNAFYNDHLLQYGYILKAVAWAVHFSKSGAALGVNATALQRLSTQALAFARDIANPDDSRDKAFTYLRHKDVFDGHSWQEGYDYSGRSLTWVNQQSGGEAINGYYSLYLLGVALNDTNVRDWGRIQMATEAFSISNYQHLTNDTAEAAQLPTPEINQWGKCLSILIGNGASGATYYGPNPLFQCGITLLPITQFHGEWVRREWAREAAAWIRWHNNRTGLCVYFNPLNASMRGNNPCPGEYNNKSFTGNAWGCCGTDEGFPLNQWRAFPEWFPYLYILDALAGRDEAAWNALQYANFSAPTKDLPFPYVNSQGRVVGFQHDLSLTQALFFVATLHDSSK
jgi:hypothetical protein